MVIDTPEVSHGTNARSASQCAGDSKQIFHEDREPALKRLVYPVLIFFPRNDTFTLLLESFAFIFMGHFDPGAR